MDRQELLTRESSEGPHTRIHVGFAAWTRGKNYLSTKLLTLFCYN